MISTKAMFLNYKNWDRELYTGREWYLPHHSVAKPNNPKKVRRVLNCASKLQGISLNSALFISPDLLQKLNHNLMRFCHYPFAVFADIEGIILEVGIFWRNNQFFVTGRSLNISTQDSFGANDLPTCASYALLRTAKDIESVFPDAPFSKNFIWMTNWTQWSHPS